MKLPEGWYFVKDSSNEYWTIIRHPEWGSIRVCDANMQFAGLDSQTTQVFPRKAVKAALALHRHRMGRK